ncbi:TIGR03618 family F420-dependent PPOX class oxidoreductase [Micromonospora chersina]|uniref:TIGR03618 family F420-dependent PPOX class oxidoreductase n=1 Tax=Micromonospora chersina TaxID=47854 RepID=UPI0033F279D1
MTPLPGTVASLAENHRQEPTGNPRQEMITMLDPDVRRALDGTSIAHLASVLPDGAPHCVPVWVGTHDDHVVIFTGPGTRKARNLRRDPRVALSLTPADDPFQPVVVRGRVVGWLEGDAAWAVVDRLATKYTGQPYPRGDERVVAVIEPERQRVGVG